MLVPVGSRRQKYDKSGPRVGAWPAVVQSHARSKRSVAILLVATVSSRHSWELGREKYVAWNKY